MQYILDTSWIELSEIVLANPITELPPDKSIVHCHLDEIDQFFSIIEKEESDNKYILISSRSDYGLDYQVDFPVSIDMLKVPEFNKMEAGKYNPLIIPARCHVERCKLSDQYSIRMYQFTGATINYVPKNIVRWYVVNCNIDHPRITRIPFGVNKEFINAAEGQLVNSYTPADIKKCYVNFSPNTLERAELLTSLKGRNGFCVKQSIPVEEYVSDILDSDAVVCPFGNGWDSYRILETIYLGKLPLWEKYHRILSAYNGLQYATLKGESMNIDKVNYENGVADLNYWREKIEKSRGLL